MTYNGQELPPPVIQNERESSFELLRLISQYFIVLYLYLLFIAKIDDDPLNKAIQMPLHVGVIIFVLLSGYFSTLPHLKNLLNF